MLLVSTQGLRHRDVVATNLVVSEISVIFVQNYCIAPRIDRSSKPYFSHVRF